MKGKRTYRKKRISRKKKYTRKDYGHRSTPSVFIASAQAPFPQRILTRMDWATHHEFIVSAAANNMAWYNVRMNSIYDPQYNVGGTEATGYSMYSQLYYSYRVYKMDWEIVLTSALDDLSNSVIGNTILMAVPATAIDLIANFTDIGQALSTPNVKWSTQDNDQSNRRLRGTVYLPSFFGVSNTEYKADGLYASTFGANPSANALLAFGAYNTFADAETTVAVSVLIKTRYYVECYVPLTKNLIET